MKKSLFFVFCLFVAGLVFAADQPNFSPVYLSSESVFVPGLAQPRHITYNVAPTNRQTCITDIALSAANFPTTFNFYILDTQAKTTSYALAVTTGPVVHSFYKENPLCLTPGSTTFVYISSGSFKVNVLGYEKGRN